MFLHCEPDGFIVTLEQQNSLFIIKEEEKSGKESVKVAFSPERAKSVYKKSVENHNERREY